MADGRQGNGESDEGRRSGHRMSVIPCRQNPELREKIVEFGTGP